MSITSYISVDFYMKTIKKKKYPVFHLIYDWCFIPYKGMLHITSCIQNKK
jgi:hypothetical protein